MAQIAEFVVALNFTPNAFSRLVMASSSTPNTVVRS